MRITPKNWQKFQHYKDRQPPWIKLHRTLIDDYDFQCLPDASRALAPMLWLLGSEAKDGTMHLTLTKLSYRLHRPEQEILAALIPLIESGFFVCDTVLLANGKRHASTMLTTRLHDAVPETETETEADCLPSDPEVGLDISLGISRKDSTP